MERKKLIGKTMSRQDFLRLSGAGLAGAALLGGAACGPGTNQQQGGGQQDGQQTQEVTGEVVSIDEPREWRMGSILAADNAVVEASERFSDIVAQRTDGKITIQVIPGGALGGELDQRDAVSNGTLTMANLGLPIAAPDEKRLDLYNLYYLWESRDHMMKVVTGPIGADVLSVYEENANIKVLATNWQMGTRHTITKKPVRTPEDFNGVKIRVTAGVPLYSDLWSAMGASPVPLPFPEAYGALQAGTVDAVELPLDIMYEQGFHQLGQYLTLTEHYYYVNSIHMNNQAFAELPQEAQTMLVEAAQEAGRYSSDRVLKQQEQFRQNIADDGIELIEPDVEAFRESVQPVYENNMDLWGREFYERVNNAARSS